MHINLILNVPETTDFDALSEELQAAIAGVNPIYPPKIMAGTHSVADRKLLYAVTRVPGLNEAGLQALIDGYGLDWQILGMQSVKPQPDEVIVFEPLHTAEITPFINPDVDEAGVETPRTGLVKLSQFSIRGRDQSAWSINI